MASPTRVISPFIREIRPNVTHVHGYTLLAMFAMQAADVGPRGNAVFERLTFTPDNQLLVFEVLP